MKILSARQTRKADAYTIENEPISSLELMERAASRATEKLLEIYNDGPFIIFCGKGNNGGDGLVMARLLSERGFQTNVFIIEHKDEGSDDFETNLSALAGREVTIHHLKSAERLEGKVHPEAVLIDAILGSGLDRPLKGLIAEVVEALNQMPQEKVAVDIPTGLFADSNEDNDLNIPFQVDHTLTFQHPKKAFMHAQTAPLAGQCHVIDIGLLQEFYREAKSKEFYVEEWEVAGFYKPRKKYSYKGTYGHAYLLGGQEDKAGAVILAAEAALRSGVGLLTVNIPRAIRSSLNTRLPEAMAHFRDEEMGLLDQSYSAIGCGPGLGTSDEAASLLKKLIQNSGQPLVLDADALNLLSENPTWLNFLKPMTVLTPHPGELKRLLKVKKLDWDYPEKLSEFAQKYGVIVVLKDAITTVATPDGKLFYCDFASPALATAGAGDVLTGIITGLLSQQYAPLQAVLLAIYLHGSAGKAAAQKAAQETVLASDVIGNLPQAFRMLQAVR